MTPYSGIMLAAMMSMMSTRRDVRLRRRCRIGHSSAPSIPALGVSTPTSTRELGGIWSDVFAKRRAVEVSVVNPGKRHFSNAGAAREGGFIYHRKGGTMRRDSGTCCVAVEYSPTVTYRLISSMHLLLLAAQTIQWQQQVPRRMRVRS